MEEKMKVLIDIHHHDLFRSLYYLFNNRFNFDIYVPYGLEWNIQHSIAKYDHEDVVRQYLVEVKDWINICGSMGNIKFLTVEEYKNINIDIHVSTLLSNIRPFDDLIKHYQPKSKHIIQVGNNFPSELIDSIGKNLLSSSIVVYKLSKIRHKLFYHQEFDTNLFKPEHNKIKNTIKSFQHYFGTGCAPFQKDFKYFCELKNSMENFNFSCHGNGGDAGNISSIPTMISDAVKNTGFIYHVKPQGDGYGFIYHTAIACGIPIIYKSEYLMYNDIKMTPLLFLDNSDLFVDLSIMSNEQVIRKINHIYNNYDDISDRIYRKFNAEIDFDSEFVKIKKFVENLE